MHTDFNSLFLSVCTLAQLFNLYDQVITLFSRDVAYIFVLLLILLLEIRKHLFYIPKINTVAAILYKKV